MEYISIYFYLFIIILLMIYYALPHKVRWIMLLLGSMAFYYQISKNGLWIILGTIILSYVSARLIEKLSDRKCLKRGVLIAGIMGTVIPWFIIKNGNFLLVSIFQFEEISWLVPVGISFYTLQVAAYLADVYKGRIISQKNIAKYMLFVLFFPQILQGPIPRYGRLANQLYAGHSFDENRFVRSVQLIIWGFFLKLMIADKAAVIVNTVFGDYITYGGTFVLMAGILYSIELYTDFLACVTISQGVAGLFGIDLEDNFRQPYFALSTKDFWRRWHISLSNWLRDYIYIPLGGNQKGKIKKYTFLVITFVVSGIWHGAGYKFLFWGLLHAVYQIFGEVSGGIKEKIYRIIHLEGTETQSLIKKIGTFFWVMAGWIIFRSDSLRDGFQMIHSMLFIHNPWVLFDNSLFELGLEWKECIVLLLAILILFAVSKLQERGKSVRDIIGKRHIVIRWGLYLMAIVCIMTFGTYGFGYDIQDFIYGGF